MTEISRLSSRRMQVHEAIARSVCDNGATTMFGLIGDGNLFMVDSFVRACACRFISSAHEAGAAFMALGYSYMTQNVAVCSITHGPALTNIITPLVQGVKASLPIVVLCGDTPILDREHQQTVAQRELISATGAGYEPLRSASTVAVDVAMAFQRAKAERRPIVLNMPIELQWQESEYFPVVHRSYDLSALVHEGPDVDQAVGMIASAKRPLIIAGRGATDPEAKKALIALARRLDAPLATTLRAKDLFKGEPSNIGIFGNLSSPAALDVIMASDCLIAFGASMTKFTTDNRTLLKGKRIVQVSRDQSSITSRSFPDAAMIGDPAKVANWTIKLLDEAEISPSKFFNEEMRERLDGHGQSQRIDRSTETTIDISTALNKINDAVPPDRVLVTDVGRFMLETWKRVDVTRPERFLPTHEFGCIGTGMGQAIGAALAERSQTVLLVSGDGGFMLGGLQELHVAVREQLKLIIVVCNDGGYGAEHIQFRNRGMEPDLSLINWPSFTGVAKAMGVQAIAVHNKVELELATRAIEDGVFPLLIELHLDPDQVPGFDQ